MMILKKASVLLFVIFTTSFVSNAETISADASFKNKETVSILTIDTPTSRHDIFENNVGWLFNRVPYLKVKLIDSLGTSTFVANSVPQNLVQTPAQNTLPNQEPINLSPQQSVVPIVPVPQTIENFRPDFVEMEKKSYSYLFVYTMHDSNGQRTISYKVFDSLYQSSILTKSYTFPVTDFVKAQKNIATDIYFAITGEFPFFNGKIFYTERAKPADNQVLYSEDIHHNKIRYTSLSSMITTPTYCKGGQKAFFSERQKYYMNIQAIDTLSLGKISPRLPKSFENLNISSPDVSQNCEKLLFSASDGKTSGIYMYSFKDASVTKVIENVNINTRPAFGNDGMIYYISDRYGPPKIFAKSKGKDEKVVSRGLGAYLSFSISPAMEKIAFVKIFNGEFYLGVMNMDGSSEILLKNAYIIEAPSWAPMGNNLLVAIQDGKKSVRKIYSVSTLTSYSYPLWVRPSNIVQANWSLLERDTLTPNSNNL